MNRLSLTTFGAALTVAVACSSSRPVAVRPPDPPRPEPAANDAAGARAPRPGSVPATETRGAAAAAESPERAKVAETRAPDPVPAEPQSACNEQPPQEFLIRGTYYPKGDAAEMKRRRALHDEATKYRTERYGYFAGHGKREWNPRPPGDQVKEVKFMGLPVKMHEKVLPALACVEEEIRHACGSTPYQPRGLAGIRYHNTFLGGEVTNHAYGIAIDIDPGLNTCCGCVKPWSEDPRCSRPAKSEYDRMGMPECWVHAFERFGFYWLGHDVLKDTMHFEFLGDPDKIQRQPAHAAR